MQTRNIAATLFMGGLTLYTFSFCTWADTPAMPPNTELIHPTPNSALVQFVRSVVEANPRVQAAYSAFNASKALQSAAARPLYNPELEFGAENADADTRTLGVSQTIDWGGKRSARTEVASADSLATEADYLLTRRTITTELLSALAAYQTGLQRHVLATERVGLMREFSELAKKRFNAGDMPQVEYNLANLMFADANMQRATAAADLTNARQQVNNLTPLTTSAQWPTLSTALPVLPKQGFLQRKLQLLLINLPEVRAARYRVDSANAMVALRKREKRLDPTISLIGGEEDGERLVGLNLSIPLPIRNRFSHEVTAAYEQFQQAQQMADDVLRRAHARLTNALERYQIAQNAWQVWEQFGQPSLQQQGDQLRGLWQSNELSTTEYLVQINQTIDSQDSALELRQTLWSAWFEQLAASGQVGQWIGPFNRTNNVENSGSPRN